MKKAALSHPKTHDLADRLEVTRPTVLGHLELLFDFTAEHAPQGNIGKWTNGSIARACDWNGDPDVFVRSLVASGWVDERSGWRLLIHDWPDHCENWVKAKLSRLGLGFAETAEPTAEATAEATAEPTAEPTSFPSLPSVNLPNPPTGGSGGDKFSKWWELVHQKKGKRPAEAAYKQAVKRLRVERPGEDPHAYLADRMKEFAKTPNANPADREPILPSTWLNQGRYDDDPATWNGEAKKKPSAADMLSKLHDLEKRKDQK